MSQSRYTYFVVHSSVWSVIGRMSVISALLLIQERFVSFLFVNSLIHVWTEWITLVTHKDNSDYHSSFLLSLGLNGAFHNLSPFNGYSCHCDDCSFLTKFSRYRCSHVQGVQLFENWNSCPKLFPRVTPSGCLENRTCSSKQGWLTALYCHFTLPLLLIVGKTSVASLLEFLLLSLFR